MDRAHDGGVASPRGAAWRSRFFGHLPSFDADGAAAQLSDGSVLMTLQCARSGALGVERAMDGAGLRSVVGLGRMLAHEIKNPLAGIRGAALLLKSGVKRRGHGPGPADRRRN